MNKFLENIWLELTPTSFLDFRKYKINKEALKPFIEAKIKAILEEENLLMVDVPYDIMNKDHIGPEGNKAIGLFRYIKEDLNDEIYVKYIDLISKVDKTKLDYTHIYPRIEISEQGNLFTKLHELGHYFLYKENVKQSEEAADYYIFTFFDEHLPSFFKWIFRIEIEVRANVELKFSRRDIINSIKEYKEFQKL